MLSRKAVFRSILCALLAAAFLCGCAAGADVAVESAAEPEAAIPAADTAAGEEARPELVAYVPLDDRSVNTKRVEYLAASCGCELLMPELEDYRTLLDGQPQALSSSDTEHGNREALLRWLEDTESAGCDDYILSLDQLMSGGLAGSRYLTMEDDASFGLSQGENTGIYAEMLDFLSRLAEDGENRIYIVDTIMRLCFTDSYGGCDGALYGALRQYSSLERPAVAGELTIAKIAEAYPLTVGGTAMEALGPDCAAVLESAELEGMPALTRFHGARERKLRMITDAAELLGKYENVSFFIGRDDSSVERNIQTNDVDYVNKILSSCAGSVFLYDGADELGMCAAARMYAEREGALGAASLSVEYFGGGEDKVLSVYDSQPLAESVANHAESVGAVVADGGDIELLIFTAEDGNIENNCAALMERFEINAETGKPTIIIDLSGGEGPETLAEALMASGDMTMLFGFSSYNTVGNSIGIAMSMGVSRYNYLQCADAVSKECSRQHMSSLATAFIKEFCYKGAVQKQISESVSAMGLYSGNFYLNTEPNMAALEAELTARMDAESAELLSAMGNCRAVTSLKPYAEEELGAVSVSDYSFPWRRAFEIDFSVGVGETGA